MISRIKNKLWLLLFKYISLSVFILINTFQQLTRNVLIPIRTNLYKTMIILNFHPKQLPH